MKYFENPDQATQYLRQAIPLMVKYRITPNPLNYALWYTYASNRLPELNQELETTVESYGTCPSLLSEELFRSHLLQQDSDSGQKVQNELVSLVNDLHKHTGETARETADYSNLLDESLSALQNSSSQSELEKVVENLASNTSAISERTQAFQQRIDKAQAEIKALRSELEKTRQTASQDSLTGLYNRRVFDSELSQLLHQTGAHSALVLMDIDHFKHFNDTYGHLMGDKVLQYTAKMLQSECISPMLAARFGGEEFALLLPNTSVEQAFKLCETLRHKIEATRLRQKRTGDMINAVTASFGIAATRIGDQPETIIERADAALYQAKAAGRNCCQIAG